MDASVSSGRPPFFATTRSTIRAAVSASDNVTATGTCSGSAGAGSGGVLLGRMVMIGVPVVTRDWTMVEPTEDGLLGDQRVAQGDRVGDHAEVVRTARQAATSLPSAVEAISTAAGCVSPTS